METDEPCDQKLEPGKQVSRAVK